MHSIRVKMTVITIAAILTTILSVFIVGYSTVQKENDRRSVEMMSLLGQNTQNAMEEYLVSISKSVEMAANIASDTLDSVILVENGAAGSESKNGRQTAGQKARLNAYLGEYCARLQEDFSSIATHTHGVVTYYYCLCPEISETEHGFFYSKVGKTGFEEQEPLDARELDPEDTAHTGWYYTTIKRGRPSWVGPYTAHFLGEMWTCSYLVPIYKAGSLIGILGMDIPLDTLIEQVEPIRVFNSGYACLLNADGSILYHPKLPLGSEPELLGVSDARLLLLQESSGSELVRYTSGGKRWQMYFSTLSNGLKLVITAPTAEVNASLHRVYQIILPVTAAIIALFMMITLLVMGIITRPLQQLTKASKRLADADYEVELPYRSRDEIGELTAAFTRMRDDLRHTIGELNRRAYTDALTGLPNMRRFFRSGEAVRDRMIADGRRPVMLYFNLTGMKEYNRQFGMEEGDRLIRGIGRILLAHYGEDGICCLGQDHFAAVADETGLEEGLKRVFEECRNVNEGRSLPLRVGIYPGSLENVNVSVACDRAKYAGDKCRSPYTSGFAYFDSAMLRQIEDERYVVSHLDQALEEGWIHLYTQSIVRAASGRVCDEEALARWIDPVRGFLSPAAFIPALEEARQIYRLDLYMVDRILERMRRQMREGLYVVPVSVNLSRSDFDSCDIVEEIRSRVDAAGIGRDRLTIEITESMVGSDLTFMKEQIERFQKLGFAVWMDDFGSGYSSLDVLQHVHFDLIKFDMRFMERFHDGDEGKVILTELVRMAIGLGVETVCEGVEDREQAWFLREIGCTRIQGYYYARPQPAEQLFDHHGTDRGPGFENPGETGYYTTLGGINLYDMAVLTGEDEESLRRYFDTLPMAIMEVNGSRIRYVRCNRTYPDFLKRAFGKDFSTEEMDFASMPEGPGSCFMQEVMRCSREKSRVIADERIGTNETVHTVIRWIADNPVNGNAAVAVAVLAVL